MFMYRKSESNRYRRFIIFSLLILFSCASAAPVTSNRIREEINNIRKKISANRQYLQKLKMRRLGATGFYYIVDFNGNVIFHPQTALIGSNFKNIWFIKKVLSEKSGCLIYKLGQRRHIIFFEQINDTEILCFSILSDDIVGPALDCKSAED